ncbi:MAG: FAD-dependent monooxygenase [Immundisolibacter sp.]|uniref:FAD-dependent monooxygenase n=1 Tax=Immundisolibacter sp. TaxID=1934948 RepID=UPI003EE27D1C
MLKDAQVLVVGAGPVGLTLAIGLGRCGVKVALIERNEKPLYRPKMERCNARSMEMFRRMGLADRIRAASRFHDIPMDIYLITHWNHPPLLHLEYPSITEYGRRIADCRDGSLPLEPYQIISQYTLEPLLKSIAQETPGVAVHSGCELLSLTQDGDGVSVQTIDAHGKQRQFRADYLVGCDGGVSTVRKQLDIPLEGQGRLARQNQIFFRSRGLFEAIPVGKGRHYYFLPDTVLVVQDDMQHFMVNTTTDIGNDAEQFLRTRINLPVDIEVLNVSGWNMNLLVAERYGEGRVLMAGDAVHLVIPNGGLGMNTGIGDAVDLSWKLAATLAGWGGPGLLASYERERRPIGMFNRDSSAKATVGVQTWMNACGPHITQDSPEGDANRAEVAELAASGQRITHEMNGVELGYRYMGSPLIFDEPGETERQFIAYRPTTHPGSRLPHMWLADGTPIQDRIGDGYTLLCLGGRATDAQEAEPLARAMAAIGAPFSVLALNEPGLRAVYERDYLLLRPDMHVAWRGNGLSAEPDRMAARITGHLASGSGK